MDRLSGAVGLPAFPRASCSSRVRYPEWMRTVRPVSAVKSLAERISFRRNRSSRSHRTESSHTSPSVKGSVNGRGHQLGMGRPTDEMPSSWLFEKWVTQAMLTVLPPNASVSPRKNIWGTLLG